MIFWSELPLYVLPFFILISWVSLHIILNFFFFIIWLIYKLFIIVCSIIKNLIFLIYYHIYAILCIILVFIEWLISKGVIIIIIMSMLFYFTPVNYIYIFYYILAFFGIVVKFFLFKYVFIFCLIWKLLNLINPEEIIFIKSGFKWTYRGSLNVIDKGFIVIMSSLHNMEEEEDEDDYEQSLLANISLWFGIVLFFLLSPIYIWYIWSPFIWDYIYIIYYIIFFIAYIFYFNLNLFVYEKYKKVLYSSYIPVSNSTLMIDVLKKGVPHRNQFIKSKEEWFFYIKPQFSFIVKIAVIIIYFIYIWIVWF